MSNSFRSPRLEPNRLNVGDCILHKLQGDLVEEPRMVIESFENRSLRLLQGFRKIVGERNQVEEHSS